MVGFGRFRVIGPLGCLVLVLSLIGCARRPKDERVDVKTALLPESAADEKSLSSYQPAKPYALGSGPNGAAAIAIRRPQDVNADKRLSRVQSDPGSLLKNQFMIEDAESGVRSGANP
jgi:hypothetical protein